MDIVIYARYSSHNQTECSIEGQLEVCREYANRQGYNIVGEYIDRATTGTTDNRPQFKKMISDSEKHLFNGILVYALDRFARNRYDSATYKAKLKKNNVKVYSARENISDDPSGVLMESVLEGMAEYFSLELGQKVKRGMGLNAECCYYNGGSVPLGYKLEPVFDERFNNDLKKAVKKKYVIDEEQAPIVQKIFDMYIVNCSMAEIIRFLNDLGVKTSKGNNFNRSSIRRILINKKYIGIYSYNDMEIENGLPRIITDDVFDRVQDILSKNGEAPARRRARTEYLLTTKLYCGKCRDKMTGKSGTSKTGKLHTYYMCKSADKKMCNMYSIKKELLEDIVVKDTQEILTNENINIVANKIIEIANNEQDNECLKVIQKKLKDNDKKQRNIIATISDCEESNARKLMLNELNMLEDNKRKLERQLLTEQSKHISLSMSEVQFFLKSLRKGNLKDIKYRKMLINTLVDRVYVYTNKIIIVYNINNQEQEIEISLLKTLEDSSIDDVALP